MSCISNAYHTLVVSDGIQPIDLGGLRADLNGGGLGVREAASPQKDTKSKQRIANLS